MFYILWLACSLWVARVSASSAGLSPFSNWVEETTISSSTTPSAPASTISTVVVPVAAASEGGKVPTSPSSGTGSPNAKGELPLHPVKLLVNGLEITAYLEPSALAQLAATVSSKSETLNQEDVGDDWAEFFDPLALLPSSFLRYWDQVANSWQLLDHLVPVFASLRRVVLFVIWSKLCQIISLHLMSEF